MMSTISFYFYFFLDASPVVLRLWNPSADLGQKTRRSTGALSLIELL